MPRHDKGRHDKGHPPSTPAIPDPLTIRPGPKRQRRPKGFAQAFLSWFFGTDDDHPEASLPEHTTIQRHVLHHPLVREAIEGSPNDHLNPPELLAKRYLLTLAARYRARWLGFVAHLCHIVFNRIYGGVAVDVGGLEALMRAARDGPLVFCPSHRSHMDYLVLSYVLWRHGMTPPHIAAGDNLSFFPLGPIFRRCGAFFLRRSFRDDPLYKAVVSAYVMELVRCGISIEFFPEGTRSRTGKQQMPKFGLLTMIVDAWRRGARHDLHIVPVSIDYERVVETKSYEKELAGEQKKSENLRGLLRSTRVLRSRYGRVQVQFGAPMSLAEHATKHRLPQNVDPTYGPAWRRDIAHLGYHIMHNVAQVCSVTPTAVVCAALLSHHHRGLSQHHLIRTTDAFLDHLDRVGARLSPALQQPPQNRHNAFLEAIQRLVHAGDVVSARAGGGDREPIYSVPDDKHLLIAFSKNTIMNHLAPGAIVARAITRSPDPLQPRAAIRDRAQRLSHLCKREFLFPVDADFDTRFNAALDVLQSGGLVDTSANDTVHATDPHTLRLLGNLLDSIIEGYWITLVTLRDLSSALPLPQSDLIARTLSRAHRAFLQGTITRDETVNRTLIATAVQWSIDANLVTCTRDDEQTPVIGLAPPKATNERQPLDALIEDLDAFRSPTQAIP